MSYQTRAGTAAAAPNTWPAGADLKFDSKRINLILFAHPKCPCTRATLAELETVLTEQREKITATLCIFDPEGVPADWADTRLVRDARTISGLNVVVDRNGTLAAKFGTVTSGQVIMFDRAGRKIFSGGITGTRGQAGENRGRNLVLALARGEICSAESTPVFGCALHDDLDSQETKR